MKLKVTLDHNGFIPDQYAKFAPDNYRYDGMPTVNFPVIITDIPKNAQSLSVSLIDYDAVPVGGFPWIHWLAANLPVTNIPEHLKAHQLKNVIDGTNSTWHDVKMNQAPENPEINQAYIGPMPPDKTHLYTLRVCALDTNLPLQNGFFLNDLRTQSAAHILASATLELPARSH